MNLYNEFEINLPMKRRMPLKELGMGRSGKRNTRASMAACISALRETGEGIPQKKRIWRRRQVDAEAVPPLDKRAAKRLEGGHKQCDRLFVSEGQTLRDGGHATDFGFPFQVTENIKTSFANEG